MACDHAQFRHSVDHDALLDFLLESERLLIIQDLDGVCMELVNDPLCRQLSLDYLKAAQLLAGEFFVLTNGEHIGSRGVNGLVEQACEVLDPAGNELYLPGLAAGGVQFQTAAGVVSHPGVSADELAFLRQVPEQGRRWLTETLAGPAYGLAPKVAAQIAETCMLDNRVSPTLNLNVAHSALEVVPGAYARLQQAAAQWCEDLLAQARAAGLGDAFFVHLAPNLGRSADGAERLKPAAGDSAGTTDFQFMLRGAVKETGVLVLLNHYYARHTGTYPLGEDFNARTAPRERDALVELAVSKFDPAFMPRILAVGDTLTSSEADGAYLRGGSDRGFLELVQVLGERFGSGNVIAFVDSSRGQIRRPSVAVEHLPLEPSRALAHISDAEDPLVLNAIFPNGHAEYIEFFRTLAMLRAAVAQK